MGAMGGVGMFSAGMLGGPGIGYTQDVNASARLEELVAGRLSGSQVATKENPFLFFPPVAGLDGIEGRGNSSKNSPDYDDVERSQRSMAVSRPSRSPPPSLPRWPSATCCC